MKSKLSLILYLLTILFLGLIPGCEKEEAPLSVEISEILAGNKTNIYIRGMITSTGGSYIKEKGFVGCTIPDPDLERHIYLINKDVEDPDLIWYKGRGYFESIISNVTPGTWYFKAYAVNELGEVFGEEKVINTIEESTFYEFTMQEDDYAIIVEMDPIRSQEFFYDSFGFYYGACSFYSFFDFRLLDGWRLKKDDWGRYFDPELGTIFENQGKEAAITEMYNRLLYNGLIELLKKRYPNAQPKHGSHEIEYIIEFETFQDNWVRKFPVATYICTESGNPPEFELVKWEKNGLILYLQGTAK